MAEATAVTAVLRVTDSIALAAIHPHVPIPEGWELWEPGGVYTSARETHVELAAAALTSRYPTTILRYGWRREVEGVLPAQWALVWDDDAATRSDVTPWSSGRTHHGGRPDAWPAAECARVVEVEDAPLVVRVRPTIIRRTTPIVRTRRPHSSDTWAGHDGLRLTPTLPLPDTVHVDDFVRHGASGRTRLQVVDDWDRAMSTPHHTGVVRPEPNGRWSYGAGIGGHLTVVGHADTPEQAEQAAVAHLEQGRAELLWTHDLPPVRIIHCQPGETTYEALARLRDNA